MPSDVQLTADDVDLQADASVFVSAPALRVTGTDIFLDNTTRHTGPPGTRRALVHDVNNANVEALVLNFGGDYPGGVAVHGSHLEARQLHARQVRVINPNASPDEGAPGGRALTHSDDDALVLNELGFYSAGVRVEGKHLAVQRLRVVNPNASKDTGSPGGRALAHSDDDALIVNEDGTYKGGVRVQGSHLAAGQLHTSQLRVINPNASPDAGQPGGRALTHSNEDALVINEGGFYSAGVKVEGKHLAVQQLRVVNPNASPDAGQPGGRALTHSNEDALVINEGGFYSAGVTVEGKHLAVQRLRVVNPNASQDTGAPGGRALAQSDDDALIVNEDGTYKGGVRVQGSHLEAKQLHAEQVHARQIRLINPNASPDADAPGGRALTHSDKDALVLNEGGFYSAGVTVEGSLNVSKLQAHGLGSLIALLPGAALPGQPSTPLPLDIIKELLELRH